MSVFFGNFLNKVFAIGNVYAVHTASGSIKWQTTIGGVRFSSATLSDGMVGVVQPACGDLWYN